jgi:hypothetical protein
MRPAEPRIAIAASPREWAQRLHRHVADHGGALVRATVLHPKDALVEDVDVLVVDDVTSFLSPRLVDELHRSEGEGLVRIGTGDVGRRRLVARVGVGPDPTTPGQLHIFEVGKQRVAVSRQHPLRRGGYPCPQRHLLPDIHRTCTGHDLTKYPFVALHHDTCIEALQSMRPAFPSRGGVTSQPSMDVISSATPDMTASAIRGWWR